MFNNALARELNKKFGYPEDYNGKIENLKEVTEEKEE